MPEGIFYFPRGFLWEPPQPPIRWKEITPITNWSRWENEPGRILQTRNPGLPAIGGAVAGRRISSMPVTVRRMLIVCPLNGAVSNPRLIMG
jgi:hypothetical protein